MSQARRMLARGFDRVERGVDLAFGPEWNPLAQLGALGWFLFWIVAVTGIYLFVFFDTGVVNAYGSVERITGTHWFHAGIARSLHRYASDLMIAVMLVHLAREWCLGRHRGARWFSWLTGVPLIWLVYVSGITGYWLVWDRLAQYVAIASSELLDWLPVFGEPIARNFMTAEALSSRFFTLMVFLHIAVPLMLLLVMWIHIQRLADARTAPARGLGGIMLGALMLVSLVLPAQSQGPADLASVPAVVGIDWFILPLYPVMDLVPAGAVWGGLALFTVGLAALPWLPPRPRPAPARVFLDFCNGCNRCVEDCPYEAVELVPRTDGKPFPREARVHPDRCVACGICMGACPSSTPFRRASELVTGIDLPERPLRALREEVLAAGAALDGPDRVMTIACSHGAAGEEAPGRVVLPCVAMAPPSLIDFILSHGLADGIAVVGCPERACFNRFGIDWTEQRFAGRRDPYLRARVPRERLAVIWAGQSETARLARRLEAFRASLPSPAGEDRPTPSHAAAATAGRPREAVR